MINSIQKEDTKDNWLNEIISGNSFCCAICIGSLEEEITKEGLIRVFEPLNTPSNKEERMNSRYLSTMNPILKGKILELVIKTLQKVDPFDEVDVRSYSYFLFYLERFFTKTYLKEAFNGYYMGTVFNAWQEKKRLHEQYLKNKLQKQKEDKRIKSLLKDWSQDKRVKQKKGRDSNRAKFLKQFKILAPVEKLELILSEEIEFPYQSIPDDCLFEMNLITRHLIHKRFNKQELDILKNKFGLRKKKNKRKSWVKILRGLK